jgi:photosystem II stability/assembly factor-like uncharacterized protein
MIVDRFGHGEFYRGSFEIQEWRDTVMSTLVIATEPALLIARHGSTWSVEEHLNGESPECLALDVEKPGRIYCGTRGHGLWRSDDAGRMWNPVGAGIAHDDITAVAVSPLERGSVYAGTEPSAVFRSENGGETWHELSGLLALPSSRSWSFPPRPETHHVRWIETDPAAAGRVFVAIEAGALVRTLDGGQTWLDRVREGPFDTHTAATHRLAPGRVYAATGDGYFETSDAGDSWTSQAEGLRHNYLVGIAVDPTDPDAVIVSAASGPFVAYSPRRAEAYIYRKTARRSFQRAMEGLPEGRGTIASRFATPGEAGAMYAANNHGVFLTSDAGRSWTALEIPWPNGAFALGVEAVVCLPD